MRTVLITAGGTVEPIDGVRGITNFSSGRLGALIADTLTNSKVFLIKSRKSVMPTKAGFTDRITVIETTEG
jgi:phosphopantothenate-cysteine ligase